jgi:hypothetical protein
MKLTVLRRSKVEDGIERVRSSLSRCYFDKVKCEKGIAALESYHRNYNDKMETYMDKPCHDWASHAADAFRYLVQAYGRTGGSHMSANEHKTLLYRYRRPA